MSEFADLAGLDPEKILSNAQRQFARFQEAQERLSELVGRAEDDAGFVKVAYSAVGDVETLEINPRAARGGTAALADTIKQVIRAAKDDLERQRADTMNEVMGGGDAELSADEARADFERIMSDALGRLGDVRRQLGL